MKIVVIKKYSKYYTNNGKTNIKKTTKNNIRITSVLFSSFQENMIR